MRSILILIGFIISLNVFAQKSFEGMITYSIENAYQTDKALLKVLFSPSIIKISFIGKGRTSNDNILVHLDSGKVYVLNTDSKSYHVKNLIKRNKTENLSGQSIAGYATTAVDVTGTGFKGLLSGLSAGNIVFYKAQNLSYPVSPIYAGNTELVFVQDNKIVLGADFSIDYNVEEDSIQKNIITVRATEVVAKPIQKSELMIPKDFVKVTDSSTTIIESISGDMTYSTSDTTIISNDTLITQNITVTSTQTNIDEFIPPPPPPKANKEINKQTPEIPKKATKTKQPAIKRKKE
ncbi:MAG TPA: hypothetical protein VM888_02275 [Chitinophagaceae bacterium]|nr:hypothetical protein [Chitinophagaceae bacterium]